MYYTYVQYWRLPAAVTHTIRNKTDLLARVRRIRGQVEALERALEAERGCTEIMQQIAAFRGAANGLMTEVIEEHVRTHVASPSITSNAGRAKGADELIEIVRTYLR
jgi:DNA-binding FrmR family transcriptional regulator